MRFCVIIDRCFGWNKSDEFLHFKSLLKSIVGFRSHLIYRPNLTLVHQFIGKYYNIIVSTMDLGTHHFTKKIGA